jgi:hypothetical protein
VWYEVAQPWGRKALSHISSICHTAHVTYHEAFWVVTGTAAPVIALAAVLSSGDLNRLHADALAANGLAWQLRATKGEFFITPDPGKLAAVTTVRGEEWAKAYAAAHKDDPPVFAAPEKLPGWRFVRKSRTLLVLQGFNICLQAAVLALSLISLSERQTVLPPPILVAALVLGLLYLALAQTTSVTLGADVSDHRQWAEYEFRKLPAPRKGGG